MGSPKARTVESWRKAQPERNELEASAGVMRAKGQVVWASRLRRAVMSPETMLLMQA
jgi:hypothetical protein